MAPNSEQHKKEVRFTQIVDEEENAKYNKQKLIKSSVVLDLGHYRASILPLTILVFIFSLLIYSVRNSNPHPLTEGLFLLESYPFIFTLVCLYIIFCTVWGPRLMVNRQPIKMKTTITFYNIFQVAICIYMFYEFGFGAWIGNYNYFCAPLKYTTQPSDVRIASVVYIYYLTKLLDLLDTIFFVLNKKWENISVLHLVHHSTMVMNLWFACLYIPNGQITFSMFFNSFIHIVMYGYYFLASLGPTVRPYLWWKKYLTALQIFQLVSIFLHGSQVLFNGCHVNMGLMVVSLISSLIYIILFIDFYIKSYSQKKIDKTAIEVAEIGNKSNVSTNIRQRVQFSDKVNGSFENNLHSNVKN